MSEEFLDTILRCGLYFGAVFQLICIAAVVIVPENVSSSGHSIGKDPEGSEDETSDQNSPLASPRRPHVHHRTRKPDKKKRR